MSIHPAAPKEEKKDCPKHGQECDGHDPGKRHRRLTSLDEDEPENKNQLGKQNAHQDGMSKGHPIFLPGSLKPNNATRPLEPQTLLGYPLLWHGDYHTLGMSKEVA